jgi:hypothetical protein
MISYETYKVIHLTSLMVMFTGLSISFYGGQFKHIKILTGIGTLFALVGGMGLLARLGFPHGEPWPFWVNLKLAIWFIVGVGGAVVARRFPQFGKPAYFVGLILFLIAAMSAITKF